MTFYKKHCNFYLALSWILPSGEVSGHIMRTLKQNVKRSSDEDLRPPANRKLTCPPGEKPHPEHSSQQPEATWGSLCQNHLRCSETPAHRNCEMSMFFKTTKFGGNLLYRN